MLKYFILIGILMCSIVYTIAYPLDINKEGFTKLEYTTYYGYTGQPIYIAWDKPDGTVAGYNIQVYLAEQDRYIFYKSVTVNVTTYKYVLPLSGHYIFRIRAFNKYGESKWSYSTNATVSSVDGKPKGWWVYGYTSPPDSIEIF